MGDGSCFIVGNQSIDDVDRAIGISGDIGIVRHQENGDSFSIQLLEYPQDFHACMRIETARRLVGQEECGMIDQGTADGDPLLLAARHL